MPINSKKKGNLWENKLAKWLAQHGFKAWRDSASGGGSIEKGDIGNSLDMTIESKAAKRIELASWWKQVDHSASIHKNEPVLFIHQDGMSENEWLVVMHSNDWIEHIKKAKQEKEVIYTEKEDSRELKWKLDNLVRSAKDLIKQLGKE